MNPHLARIQIYPVKSLDGLSVSEAAVLRGFGLVHDREYVLESADGKVVNTKRAGAKLLKIRTHIDLAFGEIELRLDDEQRTFSLEREPDSIGDWFSDKLGSVVRFRRVESGSLPDDLEATGPTVVSTATLREVAGWFEGTDLDEMRRRFRATLEIDGVAAFEEDRLFAGSDERVPFRIGDVRMEGVNPCARCAVPSRDSRSGEIPEPRFAKIFAEKREASLPEWDEPGEFDHFYRLAVNTLVPESEAGKVLHVGDELVIGGR